MNSLFKMLVHRRFLLPLSAAILLAVGGGALLLLAGASPTIRPASASTGKSLPHVSPPQVPLSGSESSAVRAGMTRLGVSKYQILSVVPVNGIKAALSRADDGRVVQIDLATGEIGGVTYPIKQSVGGAATDRTQAAAMALAIRYFPWIQGAQLKSVETANHGSGPTYRYTWVQRQSGIQVAFVAAQVDPSGAPQSVAGWRTGADTLPAVNFTVSQAEGLALSRGGAGAQVSATDLVAMGSPRSPKVVWTITLTPSPTGGIVITRHLVVLIDATTGEVLQELSS